MLFPPREDCLGLPVIKITGLRGKMFFIFVFFAFLRDPLPANCEPCTNDPGQGLPGRQKQQKAMILKPLREIPADQEGSLHPRPLIAARQTNWLQARS